MTTVDVAALRVLAEIYRLDEYVPIEYADLIALIERLEAAEAAVERCRGLADDLSRPGADAFAPLWATKIRAALDGAQP